MKTELTVLGVENKSMLKVSKTLIGQADDLAQEHESFNANYIVAGRLALYELLSKIYGLTISLSMATDKEALIENMRASLATNYKIRTQANSSATNILVRYITRSDRKTAHVYARAIETAIANQIKLENFVAYIQQQGGIEQMRAFGADKNLKQIVVNDDAEKLAQKKSKLRN